MEEAAARDETKEEGEEPEMDSNRKDSERCKLQNLRVKLNSQINKELRLRSGAENLLRATSNPKVKETVALELSFVNSNLQLLKEELEELNSCMDPYQDQSEAVNVPMIPLGLKETKEVDFSLCITDVISEHYGEDGAEFEAEIRDLNQLRQSARSPSRTPLGLNLLLEYYNQLYYVDQRFCKNGHLGALFHWFDSLTGVPSSQKALAFEKGSVLFNIGALFTQIGAKQDRSDPQGIQLAIAAFRKAAGAFLYLREHFCNAPSLDMSEPSLWTLQLLMTAQAQECVYECTMKKHTFKQDHEHSMETLQVLRLAQETAQVAERYLQALRSMAQPLMKNYVPFSWSSMVQVKLQHFTALSHFYSAQALSHYGDEDYEAVAQFYSHCSTSTVHLRGPEGRRQLCKRHLRSALISWEEALRLHSLCKVLRKMDLLQSVLSADHSRALDQYSDLDEEDDFEETRDAPPVQAHSDHSPDPILPDFASVQVQDLFQKLGPLCVFSARARWGRQRTVVLPRSRGTTLGLTLRGDAPVLVTAVVPGGAAQEAGLCEGDYIVAVNGVDTKWSKHKEVVDLLLQSPDTAPSTSPGTSTDAPHPDHSEDGEAATPLSTCPALLPHSPEGGAVVRVITLHSDHTVQMPRSRSVADVGHSEKENSVSKRSILNWKRIKNKRSQRLPDRPPLTPDPTEQLY